MKPLLLFLLLFSVSLTALAQETRATKQLYALFDSEWQWTLENNPTFASFLGDKRYNTRWDDLSLWAILMRNRHRVEALEKLKRIDRRKLSVKNRLNYDLFQKDAESAIEFFKKRLFLMPISQRNGIQTSDELADSINFQTVKDYEDWIARLNAFPVYMDQTIGLLMGGEAKGMLWSKQVMSRVPGQLEKQIVDDPEASSFYSPFKTMAHDISPSDQKRLRAAAKGAIQTKIVPSFQKLKAYFTAEYLPACYPDAGIWQNHRHHQSVS